MGCGSDMNIDQARSELRRMSKRNLFKLTSNQRISRCLIGGRVCGLYLEYKGFNFCISEILGQSCQVEMSERSENRYEDLKEFSCLLPLMERPGMNPLQKEKRHIEFRVYCRDPATRSMTLLGKMTERRTKERGNNLKDLLVKAMEYYSDCVADPSTIFLLSP
jgi:hypothetical protein